MLTVSTNPPGLTIVIDGQEQTRKSPATFNLLPGPHTIEIVKGAERHPLLGRNPRPIDHRAARRSNSIAP